MTRDQARAIALEELNKVLANNCAPPQFGPPPALLVGSPLTIAERLTLAAMAAHVWAGIDWPVITGGPLTEAVKEQWAKRHLEGNEPKPDSDQEAAHGQA